MSDVALVRNVKTPETFDVCADLLLAEVDGHARFHLILQIETHLVLEKLFGMSKLFLFDICIVEIYFVAKHVSNALNKITYLLLLLAPVKLLGHYFYNI